MSKIFVKFFGKLLKINYRLQRYFLDYEAKCLQQVARVEKQAIRKAQTSNFGRGKTDRKDLACKRTRQLCNIILVIRVHCCFGH